MCKKAGLGRQIRSFYGPDGKHAPDNVQLATNVDPWLERLGLSPIQDQFPHKTSGGQRQRTAIAQTLFLEPDYLLMDKPFSSLDAPIRESLQNLTMELWQEQNLTLVLVTHAIEESAVLGQKILLQGHPPNSSTMIFDNLGAAQPSFRDKSEYFTLTRHLREKMEER
ncbi:ATP-binding cassette domain-containing protein [Chloroflexota bacterium]